MAVLLEREKTLGDNQNLVLSVTSAVAQILAHSLNKYLGQSKYLPGSYYTFSIHGHPD